MTEQEFPAGHIFQEIMRKFEMEAELEVATSQHPRALLNGCRQAGKSTIVSMIGLISAFASHFTKVLVVSRCHRRARVSKRR